MSHTNTSRVAGPAIGAIVASLSKEIGGTTYSVPTASLSDAALAYLVEYGFNQSMGDTKAVSVAEKIKAAVKALVFGPVDGADAKALLDGLTTENAAKRLSVVTTPETFGPAFSTWEAGWLQARAQARLDAIVAGTITFGQTERLSPEEKDRREIVGTMLKSALADRGMKLPKDPTELSAMQDYVYEQKKAEVDREVARRAKMRASTGSLDFSNFGKAPAQAAV